MVTDNGVPAGAFEGGLDHSCCHHWIIQPAIGPVSDGMCQKCGEVREFKNSIDYETEWSNRRESARSEMGAAPFGSLDDAEEMAG
jgi:hypothetical protein